MDDNIKSNIENQENDAKNLSVIIYIYSIIYIIFSVNLPDLDDFAAKFASKHGVNRSMVLNYVTPDYSFFPVPYIKYTVKYEDGTDKIIGYGFLGIVSIKDTFD